MLLSRVFGPVGRFAGRVAKPPARLASGAYHSTWGQRLQWPAAALGLGALVAVIVGPVMSSSTPSGQTHPTLSASAWPGLTHKQTTSSPDLATTPNNLVPACAGTGPLEQEAAAFSGRSTIVLTALLSSPAVTGVSPRNGPLTGGTSVTITGSGFSGATAVSFGVVPALTFSVVSGTEIIATAPAGVGTVDIHVLVLPALSPSTSADQYTYTVPPTPTPTLPSLPSVPGAPALPGTGGSGTAPASSGGSGSGTTGGGTTTTGGGTTESSPTTTTLPTAIGGGTVSNPPAMSLSGGGVIPNDGFGMDGQLGCDLIDNQTGQPAAGETVAQQRAVQLALSYIGTPYVWGGESTHGFDCSGLVQFVYTAVGIQLPRTAQDQYDAGPAVAPGQSVVPGDLVFFGGGQNDVTHVGIFVGNGVMVDAPHSGADVRLDQVNGFEPIVGVTDPGQ